MELVFFPLAFILMLIAFIWKKSGYEAFAFAGNMTFAGSLVYSLFDVVKRLSAGDYAALEDIYPTMVWIYLAVLLILSVMDIALCIVKKGRQ